MKPSGDLSFSLYAFFGGGLKNVTPVQGATFFGFPRCPITEYSFSRGSSDRRTRSGARMMTGSWYRPCRASLWSPPWAGEKTDIPLSSGHYWDTQRQRLMTVAGVIVCDPPPPPSPLSSLSSELGRYKIHLRTATNVLRT